MEDNLSLLKNIVLFEDFSDQQDVLKKIEKLFSERRAKKGEVILREGREGDELFIIKHGCVRILKKTLQKESFTVIILKAEQHVFFGEIGLLLNDKRSATVVAEENCTFLVTDRNKFIAFGEEEPYIALMITRQVAKILAQRLYKTNQDMVTIFSALVDEIEHERMLY